MKYLFTLFTLCFLLGCGGVKLEQKIKRDSILSPTYYVETTVWVNNWIGLPLFLEHYETVLCNLEQLEYIKKREKEKAEEVFIKVKECYESPSCFKH